MIRPIKNNILVKCFPGSDVSEGGILVPDSIRGDSDKVEIVEVGTGTSKKPMYFKKGDIGYRVHGWGEPIIDNGEKYYIMDASAIISLA
jgi:co-chaperonin GroES (HSP10)